MESNNFTYKYLKFVSFSGLTNWDTKNINRNFLKLFNTKYPIVVFGEFLSKVEIDKIKIDDNKTYKILGVRSYGNGVYLNRVVKGDTLKMRIYQKAEENHLFWCKVDTKNGAFGVITKEYENSIASSNMTFAKINIAKADTKYIQLLFKSNKISSYLDSFVTGTTNRKYILPDQLLSEIQIPLPSLQEQNRLVENYAKKIKVAEEQEQEASQLEQEIENYLLEELGIQFNYSAEEQNNSKIRLIHFKDVDRWAVDYLKASSKLFLLFNAKYQPVKLKKIILSYQYGLSQKATKENIGIPILRMNNIFESQLLLEDLKYIEYNNSVKKFILNKGDLLFNRTNSKELVGKTAVFEEDSEYTFASYLIRVVINDKIADNKYINYLFNSSILQFQKNMISRQITGQANINAQEMQELLFPLPPLEKQKEIVDYITVLKDKIKKLRILAKKNREEAIQEFEHEIFNS